MPDKNANKQSALLLIKEQSKSANDKSGWKYAVFYLLIANAIFVYPSIYKMSHTGYDTVGICSPHYLSANIIVGATGLFVLYMGKQYSRRWFFTLTAILVIMNLIIGFLTPYGILCGGFSLA